MSGLCLFNCSWTGCTEHIGSVNDHIVLAKLTFGLWEYVLKISEGASSHKNSSISRGWSALRLDRVHLYLEVFVTILCYNVFPLNLLACCELGRGHSL